MGLSPRLNLQKTGSAAGKSEKSLTAARENKFHSQPPICLGENGGKAFFQSEFTLLKELYNFIAKSVQE